MYSEPCARFTRSMMPKISVRPAASRNSSNPNCSPLRHCSRTSSIRIPRRRHPPMRTTQQMLSLPDAPPAPGMTTCRDPSGARLPLHRTARVELVLAVLHNRVDGLEREIAFRVLHHVLQIEILDRKVVVAVAIGPAH